MSDANRWKGVELNNYKFCDIAGIAASAKGWRGRSSKSSQIEGFTACKFLKSERALYVVNSRSTGISQVRLKEAIERDRRLIVDVWMTAAGARRSPMFFTSADPVEPPGAEEIVQSWRLLVLEDQEARDSLSRLFPGFNKTSLMLK